MKSSLLVFLVLGTILVLGAVPTAAFAHHREGHTANCPAFPASPNCQTAKIVQGGNDDDDSDDDKRTNTIVGSMYLKASGIALTRVNGGLIAADADLDLAGNLVRIEGNHARANLSGEIEIGNNSYEVHAQAKVKSGKVTTIDLRGDSFPGNERLILKGYLIQSQGDGNSWTFVAQNNGKFGGKTGLYAFKGQASITAPLPPTGDKNALSHFAISTIGNQVAGNEFSFTVTAINGFGNTKTDYTGTVVVSTNDGSSPAPSNKAPEFSPTSHAFVSADNGQFTFKAKMYNAKNGVTITASGSGKSGTSNTFTVSPAAIDSVKVSPTPATVAPSGTQSFEAKAYDQYSNQVATTFTWEASPATGFGSVSPTSSTGTTTFTAAAVTSAVTGTVTATAGGKTGSSNVTVGAVPGILHHFDISPIGNQVAGTPFVFTVIAKDNTGATVTNYSGTANITTNNGNSPAPANTPPAFSATSHTFAPGDNGQFTFAVTMYNAKTGVTITATDSVDSTKHGTSNAFNVAPAAIDSITLTSSASSVTAGGTVNLEAKAYDPFSNQVSTTFTWEASPATGFGSVSPTSSTGTSTFTAADVTTSVTGTVSVTAGGKSNSLSLTVNPV
jgi:hypothetical protein